MEQVEGIVLRAVDYLRGRKIVTLLTREAGVMGVMMPGGHRRKLEYQNLGNPLSCGHYILEKRGGEMWHFCDGALIELHLGVRESWAKLECALGFLSAILRSQYAGKAAPTLYELLKFFLKRVSESDNLASLKASFWLKLLKHEGIFDGEDALLEPKEIILTLTESRRFSEIESLDVSAELEKRIRDYFEIKLKD